MNLDALTFDAPTAADLHAVHRIYADPRTWGHLPSGVHTQLAQTQTMLDGVCRSWEEHRLGQWIVRQHDDAAVNFEVAAARVGKSAAGQPDPSKSAPILGLGGVQWIEPGGIPALNLGYRLAPEAMGRGLATVLASRAVTHAHAEFPGLPVVARILSTNPASVRVAEKAGLGKVWEGELPDSRSGSTPGLRRLIFADRTLEPELLAALRGLDR